MWNTRQPAYTCIDQASQLDQGSTPCGQSRTQGPQRERCLCMIVIPIYVKDVSSAGAVMTDHSFIDLLIIGEEDIVTTRNQLSEPSFRNSTSNSGSSHRFVLEEEIDIARGSARYRHRQACSRPAGECSNGRATES
jgi:hypothetical protein